MRHTSDGRAMPRGCHPAADGWMLLNKLILRVPAISMQPDTPGINPGPNSELSGISCSHPASAEQGQGAASLVFHCEARRDWTFCMCLSRADASLGSN